MFGGGPRGFADELGPAASKEAEVELWVLLLISSVSEGQMQNEGFLFFKSGAMAASNASTVSDKVE